MSFLEEKTEKEKEIMEEENLPDNNLLEEDTDKSTDDEILRLINTPVFNISLCFDSRVSRITHVGAYGTPSANTALTVNDIVSILQLGITTLQNEKELVLRQQLTQQQNQIQELQENEKAEEETE